MSTTSSNGVRQVSSQTIRATLIGDCRASALDVSVSAHSPATALARALVAAGVDPAQLLEFYRGKVLCLRGPVGAFAGLTVKCDHRGIPHFAPWKASQSTATAPNAQKSQPPLPKQPSAPKPCPRPSGEQVQDLADRIGLTTEQTEMGLRLARSGRVDLLAAVINGHTSLAQALKEISR
jgi:hypothetical protein